MSPASLALQVLCLSLPLQALAQAGGPPQAKSVNILVAPGESLHVVTVGRGVPVVLVPGLFGCAFGFRHLLTRLPSLGYRTIVIEPLAVGASGRPERADYSLTAQADRIAEAIQRIERAPVLLVAHSLSASTALRVAVRHSGLVRGLVLLDGGPSEAAASKGFRRAMSYAPWVKWMGGMRRLRPHIRRDLIASSADSSWLSDAVLTAYTAGATRDLDGTLKAYLRMAKAREPEKIASRLREIRVPLRLVVGAVPHRSGISEEQTRQLAANVAHFALDSVPGAGHYLFEEAPGAVVTAILRTAESSRIALRSEGSRP